MIVFVLRLFIVFLLSSPLTSHPIFISAAQYLAPPSSFQFPREVASVIVGDYVAYKKRFDAITALAKQRFETQSWRENIQASQRRFRLFYESTQELSQKLKTGFQIQKRDAAFWKALKPEIERLTENRYDSDLVLTYFYAIRRMFTDNDKSDFDYADAPFATRGGPVPRDPIASTFYKRGSTVELILAVLRKHSFASPYCDFDLTSLRVATKIDDYLIKKTGASHFSRLELLNFKFYRETNCYLIGQIYLTDDLAVPIVFVLDHFSTPAPTLQ